MSNEKNRAWPYEAGIIGKKAGTFAIEAKRIEYQRQSDKEPQIYFKPYPFPQDNTTDIYIDRFDGDYIITCKGNKISPIGRRGDKVHYWLTLQFANYYDNG